MRHSAADLAARLDDVVRRGEAAWTDFIEAATPVIRRAIARRSNPDEYDICADAYVLVVERLRASDFAALRDFRGDAKVSTWLSYIAHRSFSQALREARGRRHIPVAVKRLTSQHVDVYRLRFWDFAPISEVAALLGLTFEQAEELDAEVLAAIHPHEAARQLEKSGEPVSLATPIGEDGSGELGELVPFDGRPVDEALIEAQQATLVRRALDEVPDDTDYHLVWATFFDSQTVTQVAREVELTRKHLYGRRARVYEHMRETLVRAGVGGVA